MKYAFVAVIALFIGAFAAGNTDVLTQTFFPEETFVARIPLGNRSSERERGPAIEFCSFGKSEQGSPTRSVVFNEVAWMGDEESFSNERIEIKNISGKAVNVLNWQILDKDEQVKIVLSGEIDSEEFLTLRRGADFVGNLRNNEEGLRLFDENCNLVDEVFAAPDWPAGDNGNKVPMRRNLENFSWYTLGNPSEAVQFPQAEVVASEVESSETEKASGKISINTAGPEELQKITGVGPVIAQRIIDYRNANGPFGRIEDLKEVKGIGDVTFEKMRDEITL